ncbi:histidinol dehydrogenase [Pseudocnuella soli]|uniref:histidinol dehydrogenase n=1 Tax=Pseudocnuella soli TaxID=2502779 RepID=UPI00104CABF1|nr:histidinol dehydrogenase [Pseudocnuella soli]
MEILLHPEKSDWPQLLQRPYVDNSAVLQSVQQILHGVKSGGDAALVAYAQQFDGVQLSALEVSVEEIEAAAEMLSDELKEAIKQAAANIEAFHSAQISDKQMITTMPGIECWRKSVGIDKVGLYVPGGTAPLFSTVLMLAIPANLAGCKEVILCTPSGKDGAVHPAILFAASLTGVARVFKVGGAQAIAAMAYGTETVPAVYKIFGPGNQYVTAAKQLAQMDGVAIDMPAGPSEVCVLADDSANPAFIAADLLSQAEHGPDSQVLLVSISEVLVYKVAEALEAQLQQLQRKDIAAKALSNSKAIVVGDTFEAIELVNAYACEHLILNCYHAETIAEQITNAGSVFIGSYSPESAGDYASGTNHTLPTNGYARAYSGVSVDSFVKKITYQKLTREGLEGIGATVIAMAEAEGLDAHAEAVRIRLHHNE